MADCSRQGLENIFRGKIKNILVHINTSQNIATVKISIVCRAAINFCEHAFDEIYGNLLKYLRYIRALCGIYFLLKTRKF